MSMETEINLEIKKVQLGVLKERLNINSIKLLDYHLVDSGSCDSLEKEVDEWHEKLITLDNKIETLGLKNKTYISLLVLTINMFLASIYLTVENTISFNMLIISSFLSIIGFLFFYFNIRKIKKSLTINKTELNLLKGYYDNALNKHKIASAKFDLLEEKESLTSKIISIETSNQPVS